MLSPNLWSKIFPFTKRSGLRIFSGWGGGGFTFYFLMLSPNLWSKIFPFTKRSGLRIFSGWGGGGSHFTFWCWVQICGQKFFPLPSALDLEFSQGGEGGGSHFTFWCWVQICGQKFFPFTKCSGLRNGILRKLLFDRGGQCLVLTYCSWVLNWQVHIWRGVGRGGFSFLILCPKLVKSASPTFLEFCLNRSTFTL